MLAYSLRLINLRRSYIEHLFRRYELAPAAKGSDDDDLECVFWSYLCACSIPRVYLTVAHYLDYSNSSHVVSVLFPLYFTLCVISPDWITPTSSIEPRIQIPECMWRDVPCSLFHAGFFDHIIPTFQPTCPSYTPGRIHYPSTYHYIHQFCDLLR